MTGVLLSEDYSDYDYIPDEEPRPRDPATDQAKDAVMSRLFDVRFEDVFYERQIEVLFEKQFFHWITDRALGELVAEGKIRSEKQRLTAHTEIRFFWSRANRYWRRKAADIMVLVRAFSRPELGLGRHAEMMIDAAMAKGGFVPRAEKVRSYRGKEWKETGHDLDRIYERDGISYGAEIKNTLGYIEKDELTVKLAMCEFLAVRPLFIMRWAPKSYVFEVFRRGGFTLLFEYQLYPFGHGDLVKRVRDCLGLLVDSRRAVPAGTVERLLRWHEKKLAGEGR